LAKVAVTVCAADMATVQEPVPVHGPLQPVNEFPDTGVAVNVTDVPEL